MAPPRERPGAAARALLGGDEYLHLFPSEQAAREYEMRIPGARTLAPRRNGWERLLELVTEGPNVIRDQVVVIGSGKSEEQVAKLPGVVLEIAARCYARGAVDVYAGLGRIHGGK